MGETELDPLQGEGEQNRVAINRNNFKNNYNEEPI
jgi:hypothetical protein